MDGSNWTEDSANTLRNKKELIALYDKREKTLQNYLEESEIKKRRAVDKRICREIENELRCSCGRPIDSFTSCPSCDIKNSKKLQKDLA